MGFRSYLLRRLVYAVIVLFVILTFNFVLFRVMPGDPEKMIIDPNFTQDAKAELRRQYGLDDPPLTQYKNYMSALLRFDMGLSFNTRRPVWSELKERLPNTITLFLVTFISTAAVGISIGVYSAANRGGLLKIRGRRGSVRPCRSRVLCPASASAHVRILLADTADPWHHERSPA